MAGTEEDAFRAVEPNLGRLAPRLVSFDTIAPCTSLIMGLIESKESAVFRCISNWRSFITVISVIKRRLARSLVLSVP